jgi:type 1 glutamine amidotransferase
MKLNLLRDVFGLGWLALAGSTFGVESFVKSSEDRLRIEQALPEKAIASPAKPRRLLIFTLNVGYGGHPSIAYANEAFTLMGRKTGAFETEVSNDPAVFQRESLKRFDAVFFNNTVGNCFTNADLRRNLLEFVTGGGGLMGVHGSTVAFTQWPGAIEDWPEFGYLIGARGANHKDSDEHIWMMVEDPNHPLTKAFGSSFDFRDEFFRPQGTYSRQRDRVLLSIDATKSDPERGQARGDCFRPDHDYAVAWIRSYGRGRVFYCTIAHNPYVFWDPKMLQFYFAAAQFALGDLKCSTVPSAWLSPAMVAQEKLGWRLALQGSARATVSREMQAASRREIPFLAATARQNVSAEDSQPFAPSLPDDYLCQVRLACETNGVRLVSYTIETMPGDEAGWRRLFEFGRKMGLDLFVCKALPAGLDLLDDLCIEYDIRFAVNARPNGSSGVEPLLRQLKAHRSEIGVVLDLSEWPAEAELMRGARRLNTRLLAVQLPSREVKPGTLGKFLAEIQRLGLHPLFLAQDTDLQVLPMVDSFNANCLKLVSGELK